MLKTSLPGPETEALKQSLGETSCNLQVAFHVDLENSVGNFIADADGNQYLDVYTSIACVGLGYNHPRLLKAAKSDVLRSMLATRLGLGFAPPKEHREFVQRAFLDVAPRDMTRVNTAMCGTCSVETAFKMALICHA